MTKRTEGKLIITQNAIERATLNINKINRVRTQETITQGRHNPNDQKPILELGWACDKDAGQQMDILNNILVPKTQKPVKKAGQ